MTDQIAPIAPPTAGPRPAVVEEVLALVATVDRCHATLLRVLGRLLATGEVEDQTGLSLELWLGLVGRMNVGDRRTLLTAADVLRGMPAVAAAVADGQVGWSQARRIVLACQRLSIAQRAQVDEVIAGAAWDYADCEPDVLTRRVDDLVAEVLSVRETKAEQREVETRFLAMQPRLDGSGGRLWGDFDAVGFATIDQALSGRMDGPGGLEPSRGHDGASLAGASERNRVRIGRRRADALIALATDSLAGTEGCPAAPLLLATVDLTTLLSLDDAPGRLLTTLAGGTLRVTAMAARRLVEDGCDLRLIVTNDGAAVGVGRKTRVPPGWLRDATLAFHATCIEPGCDRPARACDLDHHHDWSRGGPTDSDNLAPLCRSGHTTKTNGHTHISRAGPGGTRWWHHERTGLRVEIPADTDRPRPG